jgi:chloramphenicol-sensitive protein RarD
MTELTTQRRQGVALATATYALWGLLPIYWKLLGDVPTWEILCYRLIWTVGFMAVVLRGNKAWLQIFLSEVRDIFASKKTALQLLMASVLITMNWFTYIMVIGQNRIVEASLGYFINPLVNFVLALIFLREKLSRVGLVACALALAGVVVITADAGVAPWDSLFLAVSFALYGLIKRGLPQHSYTTLTVETVLMFPLALPILLWFSPAGFMGYAVSTNLLVVGAGVITAVPLLFFAEANKRISYIAMGFIQYLSPTLSFLLAVFLYHESASPLKLGGFALIWLGIVIFSLGSLPHKK